MTCPVQTYALFLASGLAYIAMCGTDKHAATGFFLLLAYAAASRCAVLTCGMLLPACYAMSGTDMQYAATSRRSRSRYQRQVSQLRAGTVESSEMRECLY